MVKFYKVRCGSIHNARIILNISLVFKCQEVTTAVSDLFSGWSIWADMLRVRNPEIHVIEEFGIKWGLILKPVHSDPVAIDMSLSDYSRVPGLLL